jgi:hypothetical protein
MRRVALLGVAVVIVCVIAGVVWLRSGPDPSQFAHLKDPRLIRMADEKMLVVEATGDPNVVGARAFKVLFDTYYGLDGVSRRSRPPAPRARWPQPADTPKDQWVGQYALPVPASVTSLPSTTTEPEFPTSISTWTYGDVAEVLHVGPYSSEEPDIRRLHAFVRSNGYRVVGDHEEEYVRGPGMIFAGDANKYLTIIRVRVEKET